MAEVLPFRGLRYAEADLSALICPPYDVISSAEQRELYERSPLNVVRLECGESKPDGGPSDNRYTRAAATLREWLDMGVLRRDESESFYVHDQQFEHDGRLPTRRGLLARVRLYDWNEGPVLPHEHTLRRPKEDRLHLLRATRLNISPIMALFHDDDASVRGAVEAAAGAKTPLATANANGEQHSLRRIYDAGAIESLRRLLSDKTLYVVDGHHRYETALAYLKEQRSKARAWTGDEPENFALMALVAREDRGLLVLPTHRLLKDVPVPGDFVDRLKRCFVLDDVSDAGGWTELRSLLAARSEERPAFALAMGSRRLIAQVRDDRRIAASIPADASPSWRALDAAVLQEIVLRGILGIDQQSAAADGSLAFTHDGDEALRLVESGAYRLAFLLRPTPLERLLTLADAGERMPQKSTYFLPKLPAGLVMNPLD